MSRISGWKFSSLSLAKERIGKPIRRSQKQKQSGSEVDPKRKQVSTVFLPGGDSKNPFEVLHLGSGDLGLTGPRISSKALWLSGMALESEYQSRKGTMD